MSVVEHQPWSCLRPGWEGPTPVGGARATQSSVQASRDQLQLRIWLLLPPCDELQQSQVGNKGPMGRVEDRGAPNTDSPGESLGVSPRDWEVQAAQKDPWAGCSLTPREADPSCGWESHGASCGRQRVTEPKENTASCAGHLWSSALKGWCPKAPGQGLGGTTRCHYQEP